MQATKLLQNDAVATAQKVAVMEQKVEQQQMNSSEGGTPRMTGAHGGVIVQGSDFAKENMLNCKGAWCGK